MLYDDFKCPTRKASDLEGLLLIDNIKRQRKIKKVLDAFCCGKVSKILGVYGLRRTGKSVLMRSKALELIRLGKRVAYFDFELNRTLRFGDLISDLRLCVERKVEYVFIDEITFIVREVEAELSGKRFAIPEFPSRGMEVYALAMQSGICVIASGTDSYCLALAKGDALYDRMEFLHTTHIPYSEYTDIIGDVPVLDYLKVGGVLPRMDMTNTDWEEYAETAIVNNLIRSIAAIHPSSSRYRYIMELRDNEIRSLVLYAMAMTNIEFVERMVRREYSYPDFSDGIDYMGKSEPAIIFPDAFVQNIKDRLRKSFYLTRIDDDVLGFVLAEMENVLISLDAITPYGLHTIIRSRGGIKRHKADVYALAVPGLRTYQLNKTIWDVEAEVNEDVSITEKNALLAKISEGAEGHKIEALVLSETVRHLSDDYKVNQFRVFENEVDMVVEKINTREAGLFEIKRSIGFDEEQARHFTSTSFMDDFLHCFPEIAIISYNVIYGGETQVKLLERATTKTVIFVNFINIRDYLLDMDKWL